MYHQLLSGEISKMMGTIVDSPLPRIDVVGASYRMDLNDDRVEEILIPQKRDGVDWIEVRSSDQKLIFESKLPAIGSGSFIYKIKFVHLSSKVKALILFMDEGITKGKKFESTGRFFVMSFEDNDLSTMYLTIGPHFFHEKEGQRDQYWRRDYSVNIYDIDGDGIREIAVEFNHIQRIMKYKGRGEWERI